MKTQKMKTVTRRSNRNLLGLGLGLAAALPAVASASVNVQGFTPSSSMFYTWTEGALLDTGKESVKDQLYFNATYNWVRDPIVELDHTRTRRLRSLISAMNTMDLMAGYRLNDRTAFHLGLPLTLVSRPGYAEELALNDIRVGMKFRLTEDKAPIAVSLIPELRMPTGNSDLYLSDGSFGGGLTFAFEKNFRVLRASVNVGYRYSPKAELRDLDYTQKLPVALGVFFPIDKRWGVNTEVAGALTLPFNSYNNPGEAYLGARYQFSHEAAVAGGLAVGSVDPQASTNYRAILGVRFAPEMSKPRPVIKKRRVVWTPKEIKIFEEVKFHHDSAVLTDSGKSLLDEVAQVIKANRGKYKRIVVEGHTNELGGYGYNMKLSKARAASVREYLKSRGVSPAELATIGYGESRPKALPNVPREVRLEANRRVEFRVIQ